MGRFNDAALVTSSFAMIASKWRHVLVANFMFVPHASPITPALVAAKKFARDASILSIAALVKSSFARVAPRSTGALAVALTTLALNAYPIVHPAPIVAKGCVKAALHLINASIAIDMFVVEAIVLKCISKVAKAVEIANMFAKTVSRRAHGTHVHIIPGPIVTNAGVTSAVNAMRRVTNAIKYRNVTIVKNTSVVVIESNLSTRTTTMATMAVKAVTIS